MVIAIFDDAELRQRIQVAAEQGFDAGPQYLDRRLGAFRRGGAVNLGDGGRSDGRAKRGKQLFHRTAKAIGDRGACHGVGKRRQAVLQMFQRARDILAHDIGPRRQHLA